MELFLILCIAWYIISEGTDEELAFFIHYFFVNNGKIKICTIYNGGSQMADKQYLQELKDYFSDVPFWKHTGCVIESVEAGTSLLSLTVAPEHMNGNMTLHGGVYATLLDNAMGLAARSEGDMKQATTNMNIHYLAAVGEGKVYARGRIVHRTKRTITTEARVETEDGTLLAVATGSFRVLK
jgi:uncharacterized protein (TIGR00369 family)